MMNFAEWQAVRNRLNHDSLRNTWILAVAKAASVARGEVADEDYLTTFVQELELTWPLVVTDIRVLLTTFDTAVSPRPLFEAGPLSNCDSATREWLLGAIEQLWRERTNSNVLCTTGENALAAAEAAAIEIVQRWRCVEVDHTSRSVAASLLQAIETFDQTCRQLSRTISSFPRRLPI